MAQLSRKDGVDRQDDRSMGDSGHGYESSLPPEHGSHLRVKMGQTPIRNRLLEKKEPGARERKISYKGEE